MAPGPLRIFFALALAALLTACELLPPREEALPRPARSGIAAWTMTGRIAVRHDQTRHYAGIAWRHAAAADAILVTGPLGQGIAELARDAAGARLVTADNESVTAADWEELSQRVFGLAMPLSGMPRWLLGDVATAARDAAGRPQVAHADGWEIRYLDYESPLPDALPVLVEFRREDTEVRLKVDSWELE